MTELTWEKPAQTNLAVPKTARKNNDRLKFMIGGILILISIAYLILSGTVSGARYFITVDDILSDAGYLGETVRISGAVIGETIQYNKEDLILTFTISHIPETFDNLAVALHTSVNDPNLPRLQVHVANEVMPDLLQHEAQAILTGKLGTDGIFYATELLLKCPSRFEEDGGPALSGSEV